MEKRLYKLRSERKLTQQQLANELGLSQVTVASWESGTRKPTYETLCKIADYYGVTTDYLLGRTNVPNMYVHEGIDVGDGRKGTLYSTKKDLPPEEREQAERDFQYALKYGPSINLQDSNLSVEDLNRLVRQMVRQALEEQAKQDDG